MRELSRFLCPLVILVWLTTAGCPSTPFPEQEVDLTPRRMASGAGGAKPRRVLRFSVAAMQSPRETFAGFSRIFERLEAHLGVEIELVQRSSYREVNDLLAAGSLDAALLCTGSYLELMRQSPNTVVLMAVPVVAGGGSSHRSLVIVPALSAFHRLEQLEGARFAFIDELSLTGHSHFVQLLGALGHNENSWFKSVIFTRSHDRSIEAVERGLVDGAAVNSLVYEQLLRLRPALEGKLRILLESPPFLVGPVVASRRLAIARRDALRRALLALGEDRDAVQALYAVGFEGFTAVTTDEYRATQRALEANR